LGSVVFKKRVYLEYVDLGFVLLPGFEATHAMMQYGKAELNLKRVLAICMETKQRSLQFLSKLGLKKIDTIKPNEASEELLLLST